MTKRLRSETGPVDDGEGSGDSERYLIPGLPPTDDEGRSVVADPRPAATVVLVREVDAGPEVLLLRRHRGSGFAAGAWVFPGGLVDQADRDPRLLERLRGRSAEAWALRMSIADPTEAGAHVVAVIREAWEETGILLATADSSAVAGAELESAREALLGGEASFADIAERAELRLLGDSLLYLAHWITPEPEPRRYDTRFFLAPAFAGGGGGGADPVRFHPPEMVEAAWLGIRVAVNRYETGELRMLPPTIHTLRRLATFERIGEMTRALADAEVPTILPRLAESPDGMVVEVPRADRETP